MPKEIQVTFKQAYTDVFAVLFDANDTNNAANNLTETFDQPTVNYNNYLGILTEQPDSSGTFTYSGTVPSWIPRKLLNVVVKRRVGPDFSLNSPNLATGVLAWGGVDLGLVFPATFEQIQETLSEIAIVQTQLDNLFALVESQCGGGGGGVPSGDCNNSVIPFQEFYELITAAKSITVDGQTVQERDVGELIQADKYLIERRARCANKGNGWASVGRARAIPPDANGRF